MRSGPLYPVLRGEGWGEGRIGELRSSPDVPSPYPSPLGTGERGPRQSRSLTLREDTRVPIIISVGALALLMCVAYRGYSVILFAPVAAMLAVLLTYPSAVPAVFSDVFMASMVDFVKRYFPVFLLGALFGKVIEVSGFSKSIVASVIRLAGAQRAI